MKMIDVLGRTLVVLLITALMMYPIAAITGWQYSMRWGFTLWREPPTNDK